jgi:flagellar biosynthetic protein FliO
MQQTGDRREKAATHPVARLSAIGYRIFQLRSRAFEVQPPTLTPRSSRLRSLCSLSFSILLAAAFSACAEATNTASTLLPPSLPSLPSLPNAGPSLLRVLGALAIVLGLFLAAVWLFRNGRSLAFRRGRAPRLNVIESRSLGGRHAIYVVAYEQQRFLLGSTPAGINLLSHLPAASEDPDGTGDGPAAGLSFAQALSQVLRGGSTPPAKTGGLKQ